MILNFIKTSHANYQLICFQDGVTVYNKTLEAKSYLNHDLMHYCVETIAHLSNSFFAHLRGDDITNPDELMITERIVAMLQKLDIDQNYSPASYLKNINNSFTYQDQNPPDYVTYEFIENVGNMFIKLTNQYQSLKTGNENKIVLEY
jgi:hypothetical protein